MHARHFLSPYSKTKFSFVTMVVTAVVVAGFFWFLTQWQGMGASNEEPNPNLTQSSVLTLQQKLDVLHQLDLLRTQSYQPLPGGSHEAVPVSQADPGDLDASAKLNILKQLAVLNAKARVLAQ